MDGSPTPPKEAPTPPTQRRLVMVGLVGMAIMLIIAGVAVLAGRYYFERRQQPVQPPPATVAPAPR